jgi:hypothetical protein
MSCTLEMLRKERERESVYVNARLIESRNRTTNRYGSERSVVYHKTKSTQDNKDPSCLISLEARETSKAPLSLNRPTIVNGPDHVVVFIPGGSHKQRRETDSLQPYLLIAAG